MSGPSEAYTKDHRSLQRKQGGGGSASVSQSHESARQAYLRVFEGVETGQSDGKQVQRVDETEQSGS